MSRTTKTNPKTKKSNLAARVIVSAAAIPLIILLCWLGSYYFLGFVLLIGLGSFFEFRLMSEAGGIKTDIIFLPAAIAALQLNAFFQFTEFQTVLIAGVLLIILRELFRNKGSAVSNIGAGLFALLYLGLFPAALILIREAFPLNYMYGAYLVLTIISAIWVCDTSAYFAGRAFGKHKLFERVSPKKTWEGAVAGFIGSVIWLILAKFFVLDFLQWYDALIIGALIGSIGQLGDLVESLIKRDLRVKDSSSVIPGHGGIFDRFDSLIASVPVIYLYIHYFIIG